MSRAVVVVPCYNEAKRLNLRAIQEFGRRAEGIELLFVNDGSRDETLELLEQLHASHPRRFGFLHLARNGGKAEAVRQGMLLALGSEPDAGTIWKYFAYWGGTLVLDLVMVGCGQPHEHHAAWATSISGAQCCRSSPPEIGERGRTTGISFNSEKLA